MPPASPDRGRQTQLKLRTKTGCFTCKKRRVKCDEAKPRCLRCTSTGRKCDGYSSPSNTRPSSTRALNLNLHLTPRPIPPLTLFTNPSTALERRSFQFFYERTVPSLLGYTGSDFWNRLVLQVSQREKPVWHALIALGSLHENFEGDRVVPGLWLRRRGWDSFALTEYLCAIRALLGGGGEGGGKRDGGEWSKSVPVDVCLICCILFACFEVLSSHYDSAIGHIRGGIKIMKETYYDPRSGTFCHPYLKPSTVSGLEMGTLHKMLIALQDQVLTLTRDDIDMQLAHSTSFTGNPYLDIPSSFNSIAEARNIFEYYRYKAARDLRDKVGTDHNIETTSAFTALLQSYDPLIQQFSTSLHQFEQTRSENLTPREQIGLKILKIHQNMQLIRLEYGKIGVSDQVSWDKFNWLFEEIVNLAAYVVDSIHGIDCLSLSETQLEELSRQGKFKPSFTLDMGIVGPVYNTATLCRDPYIRRRAVRVLRSASRQEGCFNSHVCAVIAEHAIAIEEAAAAAIRRYSDRVHQMIPNILPSLKKFQAQAETITYCSEVPEAARLVYIYPRVDAVGKKVYMRLRQGGVDVDVPLTDVAVVEESVS
ncbi:Zn(II)2Cys6 transcription factor domain-containing protein [Aspergillus stella-maris]|uniref:Zn(II)2Cys6 transcription factor domain-containing protein n=1 Tax=Aspergillus stella-maris TaxID=1810926 RepID=UPI003CCC9C6E